MDFFLPKLGLSFIVGGLYIAFTIWLSEKFGSKIGGIAIGLPSTALVSFIFIAWTQDAASAVEASVITPAGTGACTIFLAAFIFLYNRGWMRALAISLAAWAALMFPLAFLRIDIWQSLALSAVFFAASGWYLGRFPHSNAPGLKRTKDEFLFRALTAGSIVSIAVLLGKFAGPVWGGMFAAFPAAYSSSMMLLSRKHNEKFVASVARAMLFGGIGNVAFEASFYFLVPSMGLAAGIGAAYAISIAVAGAAYAFFMR